MNRRPVAVGEIPHCCTRPMQPLDYECAAAAIKLATDDRLLWTKLGQHIYRGRRWGIWKAALNEHEVVRSKEDRAAYSKKIALKPVKWKRPRREKSPRR
jgi:hypothetical protein